MTNIANIYRLVSLARAGVCLLLNGLLLLLFSFFYIIREFDKFLHLGCQHIIDQRSFPLSVALAKRIVALSRDCVYFITSLPLNTFHQLQY